MLPNNLTALNFDDIKSSIRSYLKTRDEFVDYDFEGSGLSYLIDMLAYNTYYTAYLANMSLNEAFLQSSTVRDNIVNLAKAFNYTPRSPVAARAAFNLVVTTTPGADGVCPNNITLQKGPIASGGKYTWNLLEDQTVVIDPASCNALFECVTVYEGSIVSYEYTVDTFNPKRYIIPSAEADMSTLSVSVRANESSTSYDVYNRVENLTNVTATDRIYFLDESEDQRYEVTFGDDTSGRKLQDGEIIKLEYVVTSGVEANGTKSFSFKGSLVDSNGNTYDNSNNSQINLTIQEQGQLGAAIESVESIKFNAPRWYSAQYRAVTANDYEVIIKRIYNNVQSAVAFGGDELSPPIYGKVFIAIKTKTGSLLNDATKKQLSALLRKYAMASIEPVITDAKNVYIYPRVFVTYDTACSSRNVTAIESNVQAAIRAWAGNTQINNFGNQFKLSAFNKAITESDACINDVSTQVVMLKYVEPNLTETNTYCFTFGNPLYDSAPSKTDGGNNDGTCNKEAIVKSGRFRTAEYPNVDQYFEDDGFGKLLTYYNSGNRKIITSTSAGTINYDTGKICFGPVNIIGTGGNNLPNNYDDDDVIDLVGRTGTPKIPVEVIPGNTGIIGTPEPDTVIEIPIPSVTVAPSGTTPPPTIPINSLNPSQFESNPDVIDIPDLTGPADIADNTCF